jgi:hypothetical protein
LLHAINFNRDLLLEGIYLDNVWMVRQDFAHSEFFLGASHLVRVLIRLEHLDADEFGLFLLFPPVGQIDFGMHSVTDLLDGLNMTASLLGWFLVLAELCAQLS